MFYKKNEGAIPVNTIEFRQKYTIIFCITNVLFSILIAIILFNILNRNGDVNFTILALMFLFYALWRAYLKRKIVYLDNSRGEVKLANVPPLVWADHFSFSLNFLLFSLMAYQVTSIIWLKNGLSLLMMIFFLYIFAPILNFVLYKKGLKLIDRY